MFHSALLLYFVHFNQYENMFTKGIAKFENWQIKNLWIIVNVIVWEWRLFQAKELLTKHGLYYHDLIAYGGKEFVWKEYVWYSEVCFMLFSNG